MLPTSCWTCFLYFDNSLELTSEMGIWLLFHTCWLRLGLDYPEVVLSECVYISWVVSWYIMTWKCQHICLCSSIQVWFHNTVHQFNQFLFGISLWGHFVAVLYPFCWHVWCQSIQQPVWMGLVASSVSVDPCVWDFVITFLVLFSYTVDWLGC